MCPIMALIWEISCTKGRGNISTQSREIIIGGDYTRRLWVWRMKIFLMKVNVNACTLENSSHIRKTPTRNIFMNISPPWKIPTWNISTHVLNYSHPSFLNFFFFSLLSLLLLILLKRLFCNSMFLKCWSLYVCENLLRRSVKWRKTINEMGGNIPGENFLGGKFPGMGKFSRWHFDGNFSGGNSPVGNFPRTIFFI